MSRILYQIYETFIHSRDMGTVLLVSSIVLSVYIKMKPPGIAFTYCWLFMCFLAWISRSKEALGLAFCIGFGLNLSWYLCQLTDSLLWRNLIPYWDDFFPKWCQECLIRLADIMLHPVPLFLLLPYCKFVSMRTLFYAFVFERWYFFSVEGQPFGTGDLINIIYDFRPHLPRRTFILSQYMTNLGYALAAISRLSNVFHRRIGQIFVCSIIINTCLIHTDRFREHPRLSQSYIGSASDEVTEQYAIILNNYTISFQKKVMSNIEQIVQHQVDLLAAIRTMESPKFNIYRFYEIVKSNSSFYICPSGILISPSQFVDWELFGNITGECILRLHQYLPTFEMPKLSPIENLRGIQNLFNNYSFEMPSVNTFQEMFPNMNKNQLTSMRLLIDAIMSAFYFEHQKSSIHSESVLVPDTSTLESDEAFFELAEAFQQLFEQTSN